MSHVFVEHIFEEPLIDQEYSHLMHGPCFDMYNVQWQDSLISEDGRRKLCWFKAPDAESVRIALRKQELHPDRVWSGVVRYAVPDTPTSLRDINLVVETSGELPDRLVMLKAVLVPECPRFVDAELQCTISSSDGRRQLCLYHAKPGPATFKRIRSNLFGRANGVTDMWVSRSLAMCLCGGG